MAAPKQDDRDDGDPASQLVHGIKSAMGESQPGAADADFVVSPAMRAGFIAVAAVMLALWGASLVPAIKGLNNPNEDGFSFVPAFWATIVLLPFAYVTLMGSIAGRGKRVRRARKAFVIGVALLTLMLLLEIFRRISNATGG